VAVDNEKFLYEQLIYDNNFIIFARELFYQAQLMYTCSYNPPEKEELRKLTCSLIEQYFFDIAPHVALGISFTKSYLGDNIARIFIASPEESEALLKKYIAVPEKFFELLLKCPEEPIRIFIYKAFFGAFTSLLKFPKEGSLEVLKEFVNVMIGLIGYELSVQWTKFKQFFELLKDMVVTADDSLFAFFVEKDIIACLLDFFLERSSPLIAKNTKRYEMGNYSQSPDFGPLIDIVVFIVSRTKFPGSNEESTEKRSFELSESAMKCLQCEDLIPRYIKHSTKAIGLSDIISKLCFDNKKLTKQVCRTLLGGLESHEVTKPNQYFDLICSQLLLKDKYQNLRLDLLLGYPQSINKTNYGLADVNDIEDEVNKYVSPIDGKKSLLQALYDNRRKCEKAITKTLKVIFTLCFENEAVYNYFKRMPPPSYLFGKYMDWVPKFLEMYQNEQGYMGVNDTKEKNQLIEEAKGMYKMYQEKVLSEEIDESEQYMVGKQLDLRELTDKGIVKDKIELKVTEVTVEVYPSKPMGNYNAALLGNYLIRHFGHSSINSNSRNEGKGLGEEKKVPTNLQQISLQNENDTEVLYAIMGDKKPAVEEDQPLKDTKVHEETEIKVFNTNKESDEEGNPIKGEQIENPEISSNTEEEALAEDNPKDEGFVSPMIPGRGNNSILTTEKKLEVIQELPEDNPKTEEQLYRAIVIFHKISITCTEDIKATAKVQIRPKEGESVNFYYPISKLKCKVKKSLKTIILLQKISCDKEMGEYELDLEVKEEAVPIQLTVKVNPASNYKDDIGLIDDGLICCTSCTYANLPLTSFCEICGNILRSSPPERD